MLTVTIDREVLDEVEATVTNDGFAQYLLSHTTEFSSAVFIMQTLLNAINEAREKLNEEI